MTVCKTYVIQSKMIPETVFNIYLFRLYYYIF